MAHFYGTVQGNRGRATRMGTKTSGIAVVAASWKGAVNVEAFVNPDGQDWVNVRLVQWDGHGIYKLLYEGPINGTTEEQQKEPHQQNH